MVSVSTIAIFRTYVKRLLSGLPLERVPGFELGQSRLTVFRATGHGETRCSWTCTCRWSRAESGMLDHGERNGVPSRRS